MQTRMETSAESPRRGRFALALPVVAGALALFVAGMPASADALSLSASEPRGKGPVIPVEDADGFLWLCREDEEGKKVKVGDTATLELTPQQAEIITVAQQMADRLTLSLRSVKDANEQVADEADYLISGSGRRGTVRMIKSGEVSEVGARQ